eukprot:scpid81430/ scgid6136/ Carbohydrate sulfotransferase 14; Dermatan 4-sulfotransferase 1
MTVSTVSVVTVGTRNYLPEVPAHIDSWMDMRFAAFGRLVRCSRGLVHFASLRTRKTTICGIVVGCIIAAIYLHQRSYALVPDPDPFVSYKDQPWAPLHSRMGDVSIESVLAHQNLLAKRMARFAKVAVDESYSQEQQVLKRENPEGGDNHERPSNNDYAYEEFNLQKTVQRNCLGSVPLEELPPWQMKTLLRHLIYDDKHKIVFCSVPKSGSSSWKRVMLSLGTDGKVPSAHFKNLSSMATGATLRYMHNLPLDKAMRRLQSYFKFMFVRHPADRIAAVYSHKFTNFPESRPFKTKFGPVIQQLWKSGKFQDAEEWHLTKDPEFEHQNISFAAFVRYLIHARVDRMNEHWMPAYQLCQPCTVGYDFVGRFEDLPESANALLQHLGVPATVEYPSQTLLYRSPPFAHRDAIAMMNTLGAADHQQLNMRYEQDFTLFDYR